MKETYTDYRIIPEKNLIIEYYCGSITIEHLIKLKNQMSKEPEYNPSFSIIDDFRDARLLFKKEDIQAYMDYVKNTQKTFGKRKTVFITKTPDQVVRTTLFDILIDLPISIKTVSTIKAAIEWLELGEGENDIINSIINNLKPSDLLDELNFEKD